MVTMSTEESKLDKLIKDMAVLKKSIANLEKGGGPKKKEKDPNAPKRPLNPFFIFQKDARPKVKAALEKKTGKKATNPEVNAILKTQWEKIKDANGKEYKKFLDASNKDRERYEAERKKYIAEGEDEANEANEAETGSEEADEVNEDDVNEDDVGDSKSKPEKKTKPTKKAPPPSKSTKKVPVKTKETPAKEKTKEKPAKEKKTDDDLFDEIESISSDAFTDDNLLDESL